MDINPGRGQVIITKPVPDLKIRGTFHAEEGYYYFRNIDNRVLLGGGRNLDIQGETTTEFGENENILDALKNFMSDIILPDKDWKIDMQWSGIMALGATKTPIVERISPRIIAGVRMGGMGVALGSKVGEMLAKIALELSF